MTFGFLMPGLSFNSRDTVVCSWAAMVDSVLAQFEPRAAVAVVNLDTVTVLCEVGFGVGFGVLGVFAGGGGAAGVGGGVLPLPSLTPLSSSSACETDP